MHAAILEIVNVKKIFIVIFDAIGGCLHPPIPSLILQRKSVLNYSYYKLHPQNIATMDTFHKREGQMELHDVYFYTDTIVDFKHLLYDDNIKLIIIQSLSYLVIKKLVKVFGYVIMPNHIHLIWTQLGLNGKESPAGSFTKFTAHQ